MCEILVLVCMHDAACSWNASPGIAEISKCGLEMHWSMDLGWIGGGLVNGLGVDWSGLGWIGPVSLSRGARKTWGIA